MAKARVEIEIVATGDAAAAAGLARVRREAQQLNSEGDKANQKQARNDSARRSAARDEETIFGASSHRGSAPPGIRGGEVLNRKMAIWHASNVAREARQGAAMSGSGTARLRDAERHRDTLIEEEVKRTAPERIKNERKRFAAAEAAAAKAQADKIARDNAFVAKFSKGYVPDDISAGMGIAGRQAAEDAKYRGKLTAEREKRHRAHEAETGTEEFYRRIRHKGWETERESEKHERARRMRANRAFGLDRDGGWGGSRGWRGSMGAIGREASILAAMSGLPYPGLGYGGIAAGVGITASGIYAAYKHDQERSAQRESMRQMSIGSIGAMQQMRMNYDLGGLGGFEKNLRGITRSSGVGLADISMATAAALSSGGSASQRDILNAIRATTALSPNDAESQQAINSFILFTQRSFAGRGISLSTEAAAGLFTQLQRASTMTSPSETARYGGQSLSTLMLQNRNDDPAFLMRLYAATTQMAFDTHGRTSRTGDINISEALNKWVAPDSYLDKFGESQSVNEKDRERFNKMSKLQDRLELIGGSKSLQGAFMKDHGNFEATVQAAMESMIKGTPEWQTAMLAVTKQIGTSTTEWAESFKSKVDMVQSGSVARMSLYEKRSKNSEEELAQRSVEGGLKAASQMAVESTAKQTHGWWGQQMAWLSYKMTGGNDAKAAIAVLRGILKEVEEGNDIDKVPKITFIKEKIADVAKLAGIETKETKAEETEKKLVTGFDEGVRKQKENREAYLKNNRGSTILDLEESLGNASEEDRPLIRAAIEAQKRKLAEERIFDPVSIANMEALTVAKIPIDFARAKIKNARDEIAKQQDTMPGMRRKQELAQEIKREEKNEKDATEEFLKIQQNQENAEKRRARRKAKIDMDAKGRFGGMSDDDIILEAHKKKKAGEADKKLEEKAEEILEKKAGVDEETAASRENAAMLILRTRAKSVIKATGASPSDKANAYQDIDNLFTNPQEFNEGWPDLLNRVRDTQKAPDKKKKGSLASPYSGEDRVDKLNEEFKKELERAVKASEENVSLLDDIKGVLISIAGLIEKGGTESLGFRQVSRFAPRSDTEFFDRNYSNVS